MRISDWSSDVCSSDLERYLGRAIADPFTRVLLDCAGPQPGERVLDLAAGTGSVARYVAPIVGAEGRVVAVDVNAAMLAVGRALPGPDGPPIEWWEGDAVNLELPKDRKSTRLNSSH